MFYTRLLPITLMALIIALPALSSSVLAQQSGNQPAGDKPRGVNLWQPGDSGDRLFVSGWVHDSDNQPVTGAVLRIWQADGSGEYRQDRYRTMLTTSDEGKYGFGTVVPGQYSGVKHIHMIVTHDDYPPLQTEILFIGDPYLSESTQREHAIFLEETNVNNEKVMYGRFDIEMKRAGE